MRLEAFAAGITVLLVRCITQTSADQASNARSDALYLVALATALPRLQNLQASELINGETSWAITSAPAYTDLSLAPSWCSFKGVICGVDPSNVQYRRTTKICLGRMNLRGTLPELTRQNNMMGLIWLDFSDNMLTGTIPSTLGRLNNLINLDLGNNKLSATIPSTLGSLTRLLYFYLDINLLSGTIPSTLDKLTSIRYLALNDNQLNGTIPSTLGKLTSIRYLAFNHNQLKGTIPSTFSSLTGLSHLLLHNNLLSGTIPSTLGKLTVLNTLNLHNNLLSGTIPTLNQPSLHSIDLNSNYFIMGPITELSPSTFSAAALAH